MTKQGAGVRSEVILTVAEAIEGGKLPTLGFNMRDYIMPASADVQDWTGQNHQMVGDIAGWTVSLFTRDGVQRLHPLSLAMLRQIAENADMLNYVADVFEIGDEKALHLCAPWHEVENFAVRRKIQSSLHAVNAVEVLRYLAKTGEVVWDPRYRFDVANVDYSLIEQRLAAGHSLVLQAGDELFPDDPMPDRETDPAEYRFWKARNFARIYGGNARTGARLLAEHSETDETL